MSASRSTRCTATYVAENTLARDLQSVSHVHATFEKQREPGSEVLHQVLEPEPDTDAEPAEHDRRGAEIRPELRQRTLDPLE